MHMQARHSWRAKEVVVAALLLLVIFADTSKADQGQDPNNASIYVNDDGHMVLEDSDARVSLKDLLAELQRLGQTVSTMQTGNAEREEETAQLQLEAAQLRKAVSTLDTQSAELNRTGSALTSQAAELEAEVLQLRAETSLLRTENAQLQMTASVAFTHITAITDAGSYNVSLSFANRTALLPPSVPVYVEAGGAGGGGGGRCSSSNGQTAWLAASGGGGGTNPVTNGPGVLHGRGDIGPVVMLGRGADGGYPGVANSNAGLPGGNGGYAAGVFRVDVTPTQNTQLNAVVGRGGTGATSTCDAHGRDGADGFVIFHLPEAINITVIRTA
ncbi:hypothetical protein PTSG_05356 [Salpingoeca rosetta]|uniref:Uncharacterized protein n=1 Tax=Salpingoeca rosetta (strain ATCC 50818 / BSB-021) TaxID=946362 RepID=F2UA71_SALR5|nr:uncharacterized protein PTSG_05356 [Salpingoeca rosetta]EGD73646.1 hypothetical protein PTSG_05356 [Salpingoeca rosetta]|eukprot:XP_004993927.1 hypothetical protein PTSG_05356 [Salpingoeca rosetta]